MTTNKSEEAKQPVQLSPATFAEPGVYELSAGDVIRALHSQESKRKRDDPDYHQRDIGISFRSAPEGLLAAIDHISISSGMHKSIVTKCLSHHAMSWYQNLPQVVGLAQLYSRIHYKSDGHPDIVRKLERDDYEFAWPAGSQGEREVRSLRSVAFVLGYFSDISSALGVPVFKLLLSGLCWSISGNVEKWTEQTVERFLIPEHQRMADYLSERFFTMLYLDNLLKFRSGEIQVDEYVAEQMEGKENK